MLRTASVVALSALALALGGCSLDAKKDASQAIASFLAAAQRGDAAAIEPLLERPAIRADLRDRLAELGRASGIDVGGGPSEFAMDRMITPEAIARAESHTSLRPGATADQIAPLLKMTDSTHACLQDAAKDRCALTFARRGKAWRLVGMLALAPGSS
jgi:hypothetical protein